MAYSGAWRRSLRASTDPPRAATIDPEHSHPIDHPDALPMGDLTGAPGLPEEWVGGQYEQGNVRPAYVDATPVDHMAGLGSLPGVDLETAQRVATAAHSEDYGAASERGYVRPRYQAGSRRHVEVVSPDNAGASPATLVYEETGVAAALDPHARSNRAVRRWTDPGPIDQHRYESQPRPRWQKNGTGSRARPAVQERTQYVSPEAAGGIMRPDNWAAPIVRRAARPWDESATQDPAPASDFGLGSWGL